MSKYAKAIVAIVGSIVTVLLGVVPPQSPLWTVLTAVAGLLTMLGVYQVPNAPLKAAPLSDDGQARVITKAQPPAEPPAA